MSISAANALYLIGSAAFAGGTLINSGANPALVVILLAVLFVALVAVAQ